MDIRVPTSAAPAPGGAVPAPFLVALNLTRRCNLACAHCYLDAQARRQPGPGELTTAEVKSVVDQIAGLGAPMIVLTGGEPLLRTDLYDLARHAAAQGLMVVVGTNGTLLDARRVAMLQDAGVRAVGISLDSLDPARHDAFRGRPGGWRRTMAGIDACRRGGLLFQIQFTVTDDTAGELDDMVAFARTAQASVLNVFFLVCTGRGRSVSNVSLPVYERVLHRVAELAASEQQLIVRPRCAPHFKRLAREMTPPLPLTLADGYEAGGCLAGTRYCRVTPEGELTPCPYMEISAGSVRAGGFAQLWHDAPLFAALRAPRLDGRCGACEYAALCGGCRARPLARSGQLMGEDFLCGYTPRGGARIAPALATAPEIAWSPEARARLARVPPFVRRFVERRTETYARELGAATVQVEHLHALARRRFGRSGPPGPFADTGAAESAPRSEP